LTLPETTYCVANRIVAALHNKQNKTKKKNMSTTRQHMMSIMAGTTFAVAGTTFLLAETGMVYPCVTTADGSLIAEDEAVDVGGVWYPKVLCVVTHDGTYALEDDCERVYRGWAHPYSHSARNSFYSSEQLRDAIDRGDVHHVSDRDAWYTSDDCVWSDDAGEMLHGDDAVEVDGDYYRGDSDAVRRDGHGDWFLSGSDDWVWCGGGDCEYWPIDECHECDGDWVHCEESECSSCCRCGDRISAYHSSPNPNYYRGSSGWLVGFEIEKNSVGGCEDEGDHIEELPLFSGWELDGSCGVEGITHVYDPVDESTKALFRRHLSASREYVDGPIDRTCGGHVNLSHSSIDTQRLFELFRRYAGLYYALYKGRLTNDYCRLNKELLYSQDKYVTVKRKPFGIELRLVSAVPNADVLARRFDLISETCQCITDRVSFNEFLRRHKSVLLSAYSDDRVKLASVLRLARHFQKWLDHGDLHPSIASYVG
jgi:hypothetical protein